ncbi:MULTISPECIES: UDP-2,4-diacetamido-2,4,6-trideoxy-beta-L-altropyranose hydrolase [Falsihalocynthiibacter]|uniref:UDP-2,4-diacetamido-2,4, 6-trideoxy-beta-L-altropyranose hydrolase n=1 Tax=Falsihalocynthiibacter TaxID=2854182 RepID=UPI00300171D5
MRLLIRTDGDTIIGGGHVMRCLTLANEATERGHHVEFVMAARLNTMSQRVRDSGFKVHDISPSSPPPHDPAGPAHSNWLATSWQEDARATAEAAQKLGPDWIIWDHYGLDARWTHEVRSATYTAQFMAIDDLDDRALGSERVLDQTRMSETARLNPADATLTGASFALLRPEFAALRPTALAGRNDTVTRILIAPGMVDGSGLAPLALRALAAFPDIEVEVVMGSSSQTVIEVETLLATRPKATLALDADNMAERMARADLCIGAGGMTSWERCCLGLPAMAICTADNQKAVLDALDRAGAVTALSLEQARNPNILHHALIRTISKCRNMSKAAAGLCDGLGAGRVMDVLEAKLRPMELGDTQTLYDWRNQSHIRAASLDTDELVWSNHESWMRKTLRGNEGLWMIYSEGSRDLGHVNAQIVAGKTWSWGFYVGAENAPRGAGLRMLATFLKVLFDRRDVTALEAKVRVENTRSIALHKRFGFRQIGVDDPQVLAFRLDRCDVKLAAGIWQPVKGENSDAP